MLYLRSSDGVIFPEYSASSDQQVPLPDQQVQTLRGQMTDIEANRFSQSASANQTVDTVEPGGKLVGIHLQEERCKEQG